MPYYRTSFANVSSEIGVAVDGWMDGCMHAHLFQKNAPLQTKLSHQLASEAKVSQISSVPKTVSH